MFLERVIEDFLNEYEDFPTENVIFITKTRRSSLFLRNIYAKKSHKVGISPEFITLDNLLERISGIKKMPDLQGLFELYDVYKKNTPSEADEFEKFIGWGGLLWKDFSDIDHYLIGYKDIFPYMEAIKEAEHWSVGEELSEMQKRHLLFWQSLGTYYNALQAEMFRKKQGHQGFIARIANEQIDTYKHTNKEKLHLFVGFNALTRAEESIIQYILQEMQGDIYWDIEKHLLKDNHSAGFFIKKYTNHWKYYFNKTPKWISEQEMEANIEIYGTPKNIHQIHLLTATLEKLPEKELEKTAIVLSDSDLLLPLLQSIDMNKIPINITMGYPLQQTPVNDLLSALLKLYISGRWYHKEVKSLIMQPFLSNLLSKNYKKDIISYINEHNLVYISKKHLEKHITSTDKPLINLIFDDDKNISASKLIKNILKLLFLIKESLEKEEKINMLNLEYVYNFYELFNQLDYLQEKYHFIDSIKSLYHLYNDLLIKEKLNFRGEPLQGLQIMGILEAQHIQLKNVFISSLNEGIFPKGKNANSLIPFDVRANLGLPTYKEEDYIYSYYFYRILQHSETAKLFYNTETDGLKGSEKSRFILQLLATYKISPTILSSEVKILEEKPIEIAKSKEIINKLINIATGNDPKHKKGFSSSSLTTYILDPIAFYQQQILDIRDEKEVEEIVELRTFGDIIHKILEILYAPFKGKILSTKNVEGMRKEVSEITQKVFVDYQKNEDITGKNIFILRTIEEYIQKFLDIDAKKTSEEVVEIVDLEKKLLVDIKYPEFAHTIRFNGTVDRIEKRNGIPYIVDYKTGKVHPSQVTLSDENWEFLIQDFKYSKAFQLLMYAYLLQKTEIIEKETPIFVGNYSFKNLKLGFLGFKTAPKQPIVPVDRNILIRFEEKLIELLKEIFDPAVSFAHKNN